MIKDLFGILLIVNVNVIKIVILVNCKCRKKLVDKLIDECTETIEEVKLAKIRLAENENENKYSSCRVYINDSSFYNFYRNYYLFRLL